jgi:hypothetical protein
MKERDPSPMKKTLAILRGWATNGAFLLGLSVGIMFLSADWLESRFPDSKTITGAEQIALFAGLLAFLAGLVTTLLSVMKIHLDALKDRPSELTVLNLRSGESIQINPKDWMSVVSALKKVEEAGNGTAR